MTLSTTLENEIGCPSGLEPPATGTIIDPSPFVKTTNGLSRLDLAIFGAKCAGCIYKIEGGLRDMPGVTGARLNLSTSRLSVQWREDAFPPRNIIQTITQLGYRAAPFDPEKVEQESDAAGRQLLRALAVAGFATANVMLLSVSVWAGGSEMGPGTRDLMHWISAMIAIPAALYAGRPFFSSALGALKSGGANMDVPISLAVILALSLSLFEFFTGGAHTYFDAAVMLLFFLLIGRYLDHRLRLKARAAARDLLALQATMANRLNSDGTLEAVATRDVQPGDRLLLSPGDRAPVDGTIEAGSSDTDISLVTGESAPVRKGIDDTIHAGVLNLSAPLTMRADKTADESLVADLTRLIEAGEQSKSRYIRLADRAASLYVPVVHSMALATFLGWMFLSNAGAHTAILNAVAVLIITCPCALGLAAPAVQVVATGRLFRQGILVKSGDALERLAQVEAVVFDKTGTLTYGKPRLVNPEDISKDTLVAAASLARISHHPLSRAIVHNAGKGRACVNAIEHPGQGIEGTINGANIRLGRAEWVGATATNERDQHTEVWFRQGQGAPVQFIFEDTLRKDAGKTITALNGRGLKSEILSGDRKNVTQRIAAELGLSGWHGELSPQEKIARLDNLKEKGFKVAMVGDGLNDAPSLAHAHASLSPGTAADASQAAADFVYQGEGLSPVVEAIDTSRKARKRILENFAFAALYNACAVPLAALGHVTPLIAAIAMSGSSMIVTINALRLAGRIKKKKA